MTASAIAAIVAAYVPTLFSLAIVLRIVLGIFPPGGGVVSLPSTIARRSSPSSLHRASLTLAVAWTAASSDLLRW